MKQGLYQQIYFFLYWDFVEIFFFGLCEKVPNFIIISLFRRNGWLCNRFFSFVINSIICVKYCFLITFVCRIPFDYLSDMCIRNWGNMVLQKNCVSNTNNHFWILFYVKLNVCFSYCDIKFVYIKELTQLRY